MSEPVKYMNQFGSDISQDDSNAGRGRAKILEP